MNHQRHSRDESTGSVLGTASISPPFQNALQYLAPSWEDSLCLGVTGSGSGGSPPPGPPQPQARAAGCSSQRPARRALEATGACRKSHGSSHSQHWPRHKLSRNPLRSGGPAPVLRSGRGAQRGTQGEGVQNVAAPPARALETARAFAEGSPIQRHWATEAATHEPGAKAEPHISCPEHLGPRGWLPPTLPSHPTADRVPSFHFQMGAWRRG